jgi:hypothetical protein
MQGLQQQQEPGAQAAAAAASMVCRTSGRPSRLAGLLQAAGGAVCCRPGGVGGPPCPQGSGHPPPAQFLTSPPLGMFPGVSAAVSGEGPGSVPACVGVVCGRVRALSSCVLLLWVSGRGRCWEVLWGGRCNLEGEGPHSWQLHWARASWVTSVLMVLGAVGRPALLLPPHESASGTPWGTATWFLGCLLQACCGRCTSIARGALLLVTQSTCHDCCCEEMRPAAPWLGVWVCRCGACVPPPLCVLYAHPVCVHVCCFVCEGIQSDCKQLVQGCVRGAPPATAGWGRRVAPTLQHTKECERMVCMPEGVHQHTQES